MSLGGILNLDVYQSTRLKEGEDTENVVQSFDDYNTRLAETMGRHRGNLWHQAGDNVIYTFPNTALAIEAALSFDNDLVDFNHKNNKLRRPVTVRVGICPGEVSSIPESERKKTPDKNLDVSGHLEKHCPPGKILLSRQAYEAAKSWKGLFRYGPSVRHGSDVLETFVSTASRLTERETALSRGLSDRQKQVLPLIPFPCWEDIKPDSKTNLINLHQFFDETDLIVILGETRTRRAFNSNVGHPAATSDAVAVTELIHASRTNRDVIVGIDEWEDIQNHVAERNIIVIGSGITNIYAYVFNDLIEPLKFARDSKILNIMELIIANDRRYQFGHHALFVDEMNSGLLVICNNPFNVEKKMLWIAGITGMATSAAARLARELLRSGGNALPRDTPCNHPIACVVGTQLPPNAPTSHFSGRWRIEGYNLQWMIDTDGNIWSSNKLR
jgi:hypothetical protein